MTEIPIFNPHAPQVDQRNKEWVRLSGGRLCVWEMMAADKLFVLERAQRPAGPNAVPTVDTGGVMLWQIVVSCYNSDQDGAKRIFDITDIPVIQKLRAADFDRIYAAIQRVSSLADEEVSALEDFTPADKASSSAMSLAGV